MIITDEERSLMEREKRAEYPVNSIRICIDAAEDGGYRGSICGVALEKEVGFVNTNDFIIKVDEAFNRIGQPQSGQVLREFKKEGKAISYIGSPKRHYDSKDIAEREGIERTVDLIMTSRKRAEWQGILMNRKGEVIGSFASVLECLQLLGQYKD